MVALGNQRWRLRRDSYRPAGETIRTDRYDVGPLDEATAKAFVLEHHYSGSYPAARWRFGLYESGDLAGVAVFSHPCSDAVLTSVFPDVEATDAVELGRFVLLDRVPGNGETWFLARCFAGLRGHVAGVVSFSDPMPRALAGGAVVFPGHVGTIYQAFNARYLGRATPRTLRLLPDGRVFSDRAASKIRALERGYRHCVEELLEAGAPPWHHDADPEGARAWLRAALARACRPVRHPGNHRYAWGLDRAHRPAMAPNATEYPKTRKEAA